MVDSVSGGRPQTPVEAFQEQQKTNQAEKIDKIGLSYDSSNSVSHRAARGEAPLSAIETHAPSIPEPNAGTTATGVELSTAKSQSQLDQLRAGVYSSFDMIEKNHPGLATPEFQLKAENLRFEVDHLRPSSISDANLKSLQHSVKTLTDSAASPTLDADKLDQIMSEIQTRMDENSVKFSEFEIKSRSDNAQQRYDSNIENIEQYIKDVEEAKASQSSGGSWLSGIITAIFPVFEIAAQITKAVDPDTDFSLFSRNSSIGKAIGNAEKDIEDFFEPIGDKKAWGSLGNELKQGFDKVGKDTGQAFTEAGNKIADAYKPIGDKEAWGSFGNELKQGFDKVGKDTGQAFAEAGNKIADAYKPIGDKKAWENSGDEILRDLGIDPSSGKSVESVANFADGLSVAVKNEEIKIEQELSAAMQGLDVGESALTNQEMMKLLQQMKVAEENKEKLEEAIAALESGDIESLKEVAAGLSGGNAIIELIDNPEMASAGMASSLLGVPAETAKIQEDQMLQNSMAKRFS